MDKQDSPEEEVAGGYGTPTPEQETAKPGDQPAKPQEGQDGSTREDARDGSPELPSAALPSADAELDGSNTEANEPGRQFSSEPKGDPTGLPQETSPKDDDGERFDAG